jgi:hypothetical protein
MQKKEECLISRNYINVIKHNLNIVIHFVYGFILFDKFKCKQILSYLLKKTKFFVSVNCSCVRSLLFSFIMLHATLKFFNSYMHLSIISYIYFLFDFVLYFYVNYINNLRQISSSNFEN